MSFLTSTRRTWQPSEPLPLDASNTLGRSVKWFALAPFLSNGGMLAGPRLVQQASSAMIATRYGKAFNMRGGAGATAYSMSNAFVNISGAVGTFACYSARIGAESPYGHIWLSTNIGSTVYFQIGSTAGDNAFIFSQQLTGVGVSTIYNTTNTTIVMSCDGTAAGKKLFVNGLPRGTADGSAPTAFATGTKTFSFGEYIGAAGWQVDADCMLALWSSEAWGVTRARAFNADPWQIFAPQHKKLYAVSTAAAAAAAGLSAIGMAGGAGGGIGAEAFGSSA